MTITLPWVVLCPDNARMGVLKGRALLTSRYRTAKAAAALLAGNARKGEAFAGPVALDVALYEPDLRRRDVLNHAKMLGDVLEAAGVLTDDAQIAHATFRRAGLDREQPRAVLTLRAL